MGKTKSEKIKTTANGQFGASGGEVPRLKNFCIFEASASLQVLG